ncbi:cell division protease FtsH [Lachnospiraceae bacterium XBB1006]|nr:cell division protease FtsH [Lachnospiraceae bacterium XBB1006]
MKNYFEEIIGYEDIKKELRIISDMLNNPEIYQELGASINEGVILSGKPGTGKTTMAKCLIQSTNRNAYTIRKKAADGQFIKTIANVFAEARRNAPSIVLLDDLDKFSDKDDEDCDAEEFVAVQSCIDETRGMGVFVIATVNDIKKIPDSLLRAGRIGKRLKVRVPQKAEATEIIKHYIAKSSKSEELDAKSIARMLDGESCATLENVINNAAIKAAFNRQKKVTMQNMIASCLDLIFDASEGDKELPDIIRKRVAYHEAGHALVAELLDPGSVSIISIRRTAGGDYGFVRYSRSDENCGTSAEYNEAIIKTSLAGRAATELVFGETDMGATRDLHNAYIKAKHLVDDRCMYGFHNWIEDRHDAFVAENRNRTVAMVLEKNYLEVKKMLAGHREMLDRMALELLERTTLIYSDVQSFFANYKG